MNVLVACEYSGVVRDAFIARGHYALSCDLLPTESPRGNKEWFPCADGHLHELFTHQIGDVRDILDNPEENPTWDLLIAHPPCTRLTNAGVRWLHTPPRGRTLEEMWAELEEGVVLYKQLRDADIPKKAIENPIMHKYARERINPKHRQVVQPWHFGDPQFKAVGLELINLPDLVSTDKLDPPQPGTPEHAQWSKVHRMSPGPERAKERSRFFPGIADAMADQWSNL